MTTSLGPRCAIAIRPSAISFQKAESNLTESCSQRVGGIKQASAPSHHPKLPRSIGHVPFALPATLGLTKLPSDLFAKNTQVERTIISSFTMEAILARLILRILSRVLWLADAKNTSFGVIGSAIRHVASSRGIPHGYRARGDVSNGRSPIRTAGRLQRRVHHVIASTARNFPRSMFSSIAARSGKLRLKLCMFAWTGAVTPRSSCGGPAAAASTISKAFPTSRGPISRSVSGVLTANDTMSRDQSKRCSIVRARIPFFRMTSNALAAGVSTFGVKNAFSGKSGDSEKDVQIRNLARGGNRSLLVLDHTGGILLKVVRDEAAIHGPVSKQKLWNEVMTHI